MNSKIETRILANVAFNIYSVSIATNGLQWQIEWRTFCSLFFFCIIFCWKFFRILEYPSTTSKLFQSFSSLLIKFPFFVRGLIANQFQKFSELTINVKIRSYLITIIQESLKVNAVSKMQQVQSNVEVLQSTGFSRKNRNPGSTSNLPFWKSGKAN